MRATGSACVFLQYEMPEDQLSAEAVRQLADRIEQEVQVIVDLDGQCAAVCMCLCVCACVRACIRTCTLTECVM